MVKNLLASAGDTRDTGSVPSYNMLYLLPWASLVAQMVKSHSANARDPGSIPGSEDPLEKDMATHSSILAWENAQRSLAGCSPWGHKESDTAEHACVHACMLYLVNKKEYPGDLQ